MLTNRDHALSIIVEVLEHHLTQRVDLATTAYPKPSAAHTIVHDTTSNAESYAFVVLFIAEKAPLLFQPSEESP